MFIDPKFLQKSPVHAALGDLIRVGHKMAKAKPGARAKHKEELMQMVQNLGAHLNKHHASNQGPALEELLAEATHDKVHVR